MDTKTQNTIYKKLFTEEKLKLESHEIELATIYDNLKGVIDSANSGFIKALDLRGQCARLCRDSINKNKDILKELNKVEPLLKQVGLDSEIKKVTRAQQEVSKNISIIDTALNNFLSI
jgi:hypothetical protein